MLRRLSRGHARQASYSMQAWIKRIALGALLAALFVIQFVPGEKSPGKENTAKHSPGEESPSLGKKSPDKKSLGKKSPDKKIPGAANPAKDNSDNNSHAKNSPVKDRPSRDGRLPVNTLDGDSPTPP